MPITEMNKPATRNVKWLLLVLLLLMLALMFLYKKEDGRTYGEDSLVAMQQVTTKLIRKGGEIIRSGNVVRGCVTKECKERQAAVAAKAGAAKDTGAPKNSIADEGRKTALPPAPVVADGTATSAQGSVVPNYPAYPAYPAYPPYAGISGYAGGQGMPDAVAAPEQLAPAGDASQARQGAQANVAPSEPPTPRAAPGGPAYPAYPPYPDYPSYSAGPQVRGEAPRQQAEQRFSPAPATAVAKAPEISKEVVKARRAAMQKRYREAQQEYSKYLAAHPDDMDGFGELGNVYLLAQQYPEAARYYYEAATRLVDGGFVDAVAPLLPIIAQYEPMLAALIRQKIARVSH